jgi:hypothetical protein
VQHRKDRRALQGKRVKKILVVPRHAIEGCFEKPTWLGANFKNMAGVAIISIFSCVKDQLITGEFEKCLKAAGCIDTLSLLFGDITNSEAVASNDKEISERLFSVGQARLIIKFLDALKTRPIRVLLVHCDAGVSRSGAVGIFACRYLGLNEREFRAENDNIAPNTHVYNTLYVESGLKKEYERFWTTDAFKNIPADPDIGGRMFTW